MVAGVSESFVVVVRSLLVGLCVITLQPRLRFVFLGHSMANTDGTAMANGLAVRDYATTADPVPREREPSSLESKAAGPSMKALGKKREIVVQQPVAVKKAVVQAQPAPERRSTRSSNVAASSKETDASDDEDGLDDGWH